MAAFVQSRFLQSARINRIIGRLAAKLEIERPLIYLQRLPLVPAFDDELIGRFTGRVFAADIITDDHEALVYESMAVDLTTEAIPNMKFGQRLGQKLLNRLRALEAGQMSVSGENALRDWDAAVAENLLLGVRQRMNALACAMMLDTASYDRWGVKIVGASWGMPSDLKVTPTLAWSNTSATPLADVWGVNRTARLTYGITFDKLTMGTADFRNMIATTEFANKAWQVLNAAFLTTQAALPTQDDPRMLEVAKQILKMEIELDDHTYRVRANDGTETATKTLPAGKVLLSRKQDEGDGNVMDMANGVPTESIVADLVAGAPEGLGGEQYGPVAYFAPQSHDLNPPGVIAWACAKAWPRKFLEEATAVLTVA